MAFNRSSSARNSDAENNQSWKASGFLNLYLPSKDGGRRKLAGIPLRDSKPNELTLREWIEKDMETNLHILMNKLEIEYQPVAQSEGSTFDLSDPKAA